MTTINSTQYRVLEWISSDQTTDPPSPEWKTSARALERRGLVKVSRPRGKFTAKATDSGHDYLTKHQEPARSVEPNLGTITASEVSTLLPDIPDTFPKLHPAVRSLKRHPGTLSADSEARQRAINAAQYLILGAETLGIRVKGHDQPTKGSRLDRGPHTGTSFVTLSTDHVSLLVRIGEHTPQVEHQLTKEEQRRKERDQYYWGPSWDYVRSGKTFFRVDKDYGDARKFVETERKPLVKYVPNVLAFILRTSEKARIQEEEAKVWAAKRAAEEEARRILTERRKEYDQWETALTERYAEWERLENLRRFLDALAHQDNSEEARIFASWAREHLEGLNPARRFELPTPHPPDLSHAERAHYEKFEERKNFYGYGW